MLDVTSHQAHLRLPRLPYRHIRSRRNVGPGRQPVRLACRSWPVARFPPTTKTSSGFVTLARAACHGVCTSVIDSLMQDDISLRCAAIEPYPQRAGSRLPRAGPLNTRLYRIESQHVRGGRERQEAAGELQACIASTLCWVTNPELHCAEAGHAEILTMAEAE